MIRFLTAAVVILLAGVAAVVSYRHAFEVVIANGESGFTAVLVPLTIDGLIFASSMVLLDAARRRLPAPKLAYLTLALGILATLAANVMHGIAHGPVGAIVAAWPAVALVLGYELLMGLIRRSAKLEFRNEAISPIGEPVEVHAPLVPVQVTAVVDADKPADADVISITPAEVEVQPDLVPEPDVDAPYKPVVLAQFLAEVVDGEPPTVRTIKDRLSVGTDRARRLQSYLSQLVEATQ